MLNTLTATPSLVLQIPDEKSWMFTSMLQAGIEIVAQSGTSIGVFLEQLPGFSEEYIIDMVQTIFLNGTATDDLETPLIGDEPVLAISAAMPGLAGAIFRKNSLHAALRTTQSLENDTHEKGEITVCLKLFNAIARDRGEEMLRSGVIIKGSAVHQFLTTRSSLMQYITGITIDTKSLTESELFSHLEQSDRLKIQIV